MNENKICFITCVTQDYTYNECLKYIRSLSVPEGIEVEIISVTDEKNIAKAHNYTMKQTDAKYKVYLHQDTFIVNKDFIFDVINMFKRHPKLGMLGVVGYEKMPIDGEWFNSKEKIGQVLSYHNGSNNIEMLSWGELVDDYIPVEALEGFLLITQHDIDWREDLFAKEYFYDAAQSREFIRTGYEVGVVKQINPWCIYDKETTKGNYDDYKNIFLNEYGKDIFPLVSILIPTYNRPELFKMALESVLNQTYKNIEVIVCDDSTNDETKDIITEYLKANPFIKYYKNETNLGQFQNDLKCMELANGEFINFLMDDDLFHPEKITKMMKYFIQDKNCEISLVTSHRQTIDSNGNNLEDWYATQRLFNEDTIIDGLAFGEFVLKNVTNFIGEPTTVLFRKSKLKERFGTFGGRDYGCTVDLASWLNLLSEGKIVYISETLSYFRIHQGQQLQSSKMPIIGRIDFAHLTIHSRIKGFHKNNSDYIESLKSCINSIERIVNSAGTELKNIIEFPELIHMQSVLQKEMHQLLNSESYLDISKCCEVTEQWLEENSILSSRSKKDQKYIISNYVYDEENEMFISKKAPNIKYADGSEKYLIDLFEGITVIDNDSQNIIPYIKDWASKYHLSPIRHNLFNALDEILKKDTAVLELGGGMGAITWWLAQRFREIDVIEGSTYRARANVLRNKNSKNVNLFVDDLLNLQFPREKYGLATLIGVLEYLPYFSKEENKEEVCLRFLNEIANHLEDDGVLVVAIENKLGAKYFSGCVEDHNGQLFSGIMGYPNESALTFSRYEMEGMLKQSGFENIQFYHCFPDYKLPTTIIRECKEMYEWDIAGITRGLFKDYNYKREHFMNDTLLLDSLTSAHMLQDMSNSFLIVCSKSKTCNLKIEPVIVKYSNSDEKKTVFHHKTQFFSANDKKSVVREGLYNNTSILQVGDLHFQLHNEDFEEGKNLTVEAYRLVLKNDNYGSLKKLLLEVRQSLINEFALDEYVEGYQLVSGEAIDFCLNNLLRNKRTELRFVDRKWKYKNRTYTEDFIIFRSVFSLYLEIHPYIAELSSHEFIMKVLVGIYPKYNAARLIEHYHMESEFQSNVNKRPAKILGYESSADSKALTIK